MLILKYNTLRPEELFRIESRCIRWLERYSTATDDMINFNILDFDRSDVYGILLGIFTKLGILDTLALTTSKLLDFLIDISNTYHDTPYHSFYHAADVVIVLYHIMTTLEAKPYFTNMEVATLSIAAICHDAGHTGHNNAYHVKLNTEIAVRFGNISVLESLSVEIAFEYIKKHKLAVNNGSMAFIKKLILSTDMQHHYDLLTEIDEIEYITSSNNFWSEGDSLETKQRLSFACILLHAADISNAVRSWPISKQWSDLIVQEFFRQGDAEKVAGLVVSPGMDRDVATQASICLKFSDFVVGPFFQGLVGLLPKSKIFIDVLHENRQEWVTLKEEPFSTSITSYFMLNHKRHVNVPAGTILLPPDSTTTEFVKPMPILRASSHNQIPCNSSETTTQSESRRKSADNYCI